VNTASRMESHGTSGRIQITRATKELLEDEFVCEPRGTIPIKGKGEIEAWYLVCRRVNPAAKPCAHPEPVLPPEAVPGA
jgi:adenylate cyclase